VVRLRALVLVLLLGATGAIASGSAVSAASAAAGSPVTGPSSSHSPTTDPSIRAAAGTRSSQPADSVTNQPLDQANTRPSSAGSPTSASAPPSAGIGTATATIAGPTAPAWLAEINRYRRAAGLGEVTDQSTWDAGILAHLSYVASTPKGQESGRYASLHTENPASRFATGAGALEASRSDLFFDSTALTPVGFIDGWLSAPFHAIGMLRGRLTQVAFAASPDGSAAGLDVIGGLDDGRAAPTAPILFPGNGMTTNLTSYTGGESPDPLESCGWSSRNASYGLPLIALLPSAPAADLQAQVVAADGSTMSTANGQLCVVDEVTYRSTDAVYGSTGRQILQDDHAVLLIARHPYAAGRYDVTINQSGRRAIEWTFTATP
jgi:hypothetical protein